ncbi:gamma-glutamylcyclotransferase [Brevibacillus ruminantium]|uniref:Gamma-glutamylcyclotransferase n=1 Tax=Brevibacillus ruminantium TaxID=2950604 RepID=A0ABY4WN55_9BACL|nr:gamma-glutamylcyclotransferase family protein [Brevibacillus ruminantium]USG67255.1 gamma-glutamylcyclotransferase [Brevibacillus ruminantium]
MTRVLPVFVYGTLLPGFLNYERYVKPYPHTIQPATVQGCLYHLPAGYPGLVLSKTATVKGALLFFAADRYEEAIAGMDELEDYFGPDDPRNEYERELTTAVLPEGAGEVLSYHYRYSKESYAVKRGREVPAGDWRIFMQNRLRE